jgi:ABC-type phosphate/phosphonate transport system substrate-binding protein
MSKLMVRRTVLGFLISLLAMIACQPQVVLVDVTRIVEVTPATDALGPGEVSKGVESEESIEVTRVVNQVVTRVVTQTVNEELVVEVPQPALGTSQRPVQLLFSPIADVNVIAKRGRVLAERMAAVTGLQYEVGILDGEEDLIQLMCVAPADTVGFVSSVGYALANQRCDVQIGSVAVQEDGLTWQAGMIVARRDSGISTLDDLAGRRWAVPDTDSVTRFLFFQALLAEAGIDVAEMVEVPGDSSAMLAVYQGDVDFATAAYVPPILPYDERQWVFGEDSPEIWRRVGIPPRRSPIGYILVNGEPEFGGYRLRDARSRIFDTIPGIYDETFILSLSDPIPNDTVAFGARFPLGIARQIMVGLGDLASSDACIDSVCSTDFLSWAGIEPASSEAYDPLRFIIDTLQITSKESATP